MNERYGHEQKNLESVNLVILLEVGHFYLGMALVVAELGDRKK